VFNKLLCFLRDNFLLQNHHFHTILQITLSFYYYRANIDENIYSLLTTV